MLSMIINNIMVNHLYITIVKSEDNTHEHYGLLRLARMFNLSPILNLWCAGNTSIGFIYYAV